MFNDKAEDGTEISITMHLITEDALIFDRCPSLVVRQNETDEGPSLLDRAVYNVVGSGSEK